MKVEKHILGQNIEMFLQKGKAVFGDKVSDDLIDILVKNKLPIDVAIRTLSSDEQFETMPIDILFLFTKSINELLGLREYSRAFRDCGSDCDFSLKTYFTDIEIDGMKSLDMIESLEEKHIDKVNDLKHFKKVLQVAPDQYIAVVRLSQLVGMYNEGLIIYNKQTQRDPKFFTYKDDIVESININYSQIREIKESMLKGLFIPNAITLNILNDGTESFDFGDIGLQILSGKINILDGFHRSLGGIEAIQEYPDFDMDIELRITNFDIQKARQFIIQEDKQRKMDKTYIQKIEESYVNKIVDDINRKSDFKGLIRESLPKGQLGIKESSLREIMDIIYDDIPNSVEQRKISNYLVNCFNILFSIVEDGGGNVLNKDNVGFEISITKSIYDNIDTILAMDDKHTLIPLQSTLDSIIISAIKIGMIRGNEPFKLNRKSYKLLKSQTDDIVSNLISKAQSKGGRL